MGAVFMTCGYSSINEREPKDLASLKASSCSATFTAPSIIKTTATATGTLSRTGTFLCKTPSLSDSNEPLILPLPSLPCSAAMLNPAFPTAPTTAPVSVSDTTTEATVPLSSHRGSLADSEVNPVLSNVVEGSDEDEVVGTNIPVRLPSTSQSDGNLCVRARQVVLLEKERQQQQEQDHSHHHHHHRHNHSYHGQQQQHQCCARFSSGDSGGGSGKHRLHSNSCILV